MNDYERLLWALAEEFETSISSCFRKASEKYEWVEGIAEAEALMRRLRGVFVASLVGEIEERVGRRFSALFDQLSGAPTTKESRYWFEDMPKRSSPRGRAKVMWAIRIAYTHGNGHIGQIDDPNVAAYPRPEFANTHFRGITLKDDFVTLLGDVTYPAIKTVIEIDNKFGNHSTE